MFISNFLAQIPFEQFNTFLNKQYYFWFSMCMSELGLCFPLLLFFTNFSSKRIISVSSISDSLTFFLWYSEYFVEINQWIIREGLLQSSWLLPKHLQWLVTQNIFLQLFWSASTHLVEFLTPMWTAVNNLYIRFVDKNIWSWSMCKSYHMTEMDSVSLFLHASILILCFPIIYF